MADAKKCDRCGKLFEPYNIDAGCKVPKRYMNILLRNTLIDQASYKEPRDYDLCKECNDSFLKWLSKPSVVNGNRSCFGKYDEEEYGCPSCLMKNECEKVKRENKNKGCRMIGAFDGSIDCLMCPKCDECKEVTNSIKEASSNE